MGEIIIGIIAVIYILWGINSLNWFFSLLGWAPFMHWSVLVIAALLTGWFLIPLRILISIVRSIFGKKN